MAVTHPTPRNKGKFIGPKPPLKLKHIWAIRTRLQLAGRTRDLALLNLAIDSKLRGCDLVRLTVGDVAPSGSVRERTTVRQRKTSRPVQFELTEQTRQALQQWIGLSGKGASDYLFTGRSSQRPLSTRQYGRMLKTWLQGIGLDPAAFGTHSLRRTKVAMIYRRTGNLRAVQLLLGHTKLESTVRYLGIEVDDAIAIAEEVEV